MFPIIFTIKQRNNPYLYNSDFLNGPVVQRIVFGFPKLKIQVRSLTGLLKTFVISEIGIAKVLLVFSIELDEFTIK